MFRTIGLIAKHGDPRVDETLDRLIGILRSRGLEALLDARTRSAYPGGGIHVAERDTLGERCDLVVVVAGDGTFLGAARSLVDNDVPLLGVNRGRLGFLADVMPEEMPARLGEILDGDFIEERRFLLDVSVERGGECVFSEPALNEAVIHKGGMIRLMEFETYIDGRLVNSQRSDGLIVATPTGSTAYALSGGGPILHASLDAIVLVPICPHTLSSRPIVVGGESVVEVVLGPDADAEAGAPRAGTRCRGDAERLRDRQRIERQLSCDGQAAADLAPGDRILIRKHRPDLRLIHPAGYDYYATLRAKLHWGKGL